MGFHELCFLDRLALAFMLSVGSLVDFIIRRILRILNSIIRTVIKMFKGDR